MGRAPSSGTVFKLYHYREPGVSACPIAQTGGSNEPAPTRRGIGRNHAEPRRNSRDQQQIGDDDRQPRRDHVGKDARLPRNTRSKAGVFDCGDETTWYATPPPVVSIAS
jgi:hypothetical protein